MIKNKIKLCETPLNAFNVENVNSIPFYERYDEFVRVLQAGGLADVEAFLAQPQLIESTNSIEWYIPRPAGEIPIAMTHLTADELPVYEKALDALIARLETLRSQDKRPIDNQFIATVLQYAGNSADTVYCHDGQVVLAVWGMSLVHGHDRPPRAPGGIPHRRQRPVARSAGVDAPPRPHNRQCRGANSGTRRGSQFCEVGTR